MEKEMHQCPCDPACKCIMDEPCLGCESYGEWLNTRTPEVRVDRWKIYTILCEEFKIDCIKAHGITDALASGDILTTKE